ncbi:MAG: metal-dependent hydrolase [Halobacteriales archaeon]|nr:metal-dependent hydrolase [Halobacteriales archaeon]
MPSTVVHLALGGLVASALLTTEFDGRALAAILVVTAIPDLDTFIGLLVPGTHRAALHTLVVPIGLAGLVFYDTRVREHSRLRRVAADRGVIIAWTAIVAYVLAGIGPDLFFNGVNLFYPLYDRFYTISGNILLSNQQGLVQTLWQPAKSVGGTTANTHYYTGVDTARGADPKNVERVFPIARGGLQVLLILLSVTIITIRLWRHRRETRKG